MVMNVQKLVVLLIALFLTMRLLYLEVTAECILKNARLQLDVMKFASDFTDIGSQNKGLIPKDDIPSIFGIQQKS